jgi:hypothetical protein
MYSEIEVMKNIKKIPSIPDGILLNSKSNSNPNS